MKKLLLIITTLALCLLLAGCNTGDTSLSSNANNKATKFSQEVTIVKLPSPPKCKTTDSNAVVNEVIDILGLIEKTSIPNEVNASGWSTRIRIKIDGQEFVYTLGGNLFTDSDGRQYNISNCEEIEGKLTEIYNKIDANEVEYP